MLKLYAVVIGRKGRHKRYVAYKDSRNLHVYTISGQAREARREMLKAEVRNAPIHVIPFYVIPHVVGD